MLTRLEALEMRSLWDCTRSVFDDSSSCREEKENGSHKRSSVAS